MKQIKNYKNINQKRAVVEYITGEKELIETKKNKKLSHTYFDATIQFMSYTHKFVGY